MAKLRFKLVSLCLQPSKTIKNILCNIFENVEAVQYVNNLTYFCMVSTEFYSPLLGDVWPHSYKTRTVGSLEELYESTYDSPKDFVITCVLQTIEASLWFILSHIGATEAVPEELMCESSLLQPDSFLWLSDPHGDFQLFVCRHLEQKGLSIRL